MRLEVERSGGFAGRTLHWTLDVDGLDPQAQARVQDLLARPEVKELLSRPGEPVRGGADRYSYRIVSSGGATTRAGGDDAAGAAGAGAGRDEDLHEVRVADPLPAPARDLVALVRDLSG